ncbi:DevR family CRISPR-associated autoregulator [Saccharolobus caldissimus]|uniref:Type I-A CRISPR-associated protein Cas7/Csa2 n=1 Tax=Saccharolobus caldissimus TaxID=1702097 RepID=A0AAQ4CRY4_9CREN|nr:DevR family CRISPR-associated autoregulator [Saccharolobus caldissimus]BDB98565.1 type I-A CRISPR-associated protein Cas7/Csa2 [Saccharolobus caldissimus]
MPQQKTYSYENRKRIYPFISMGIRIIANVEALNMVETAGNLSRHRTVPIVVFSDGNYSLKWYPALSGETLAHAFQLALSNLEKTSSNPKLCYFCGIGEFIKHTALDFYQKILNNVNLPEWERNLLNIENEWDVENEIIKNCVVEDLGGFVIATAAREEQKSKKGKKKEEQEEEEQKTEEQRTGISIRRTSAFQFSYVVPTLDAILSGSTTTDVQMQIRMASVGQSLANSVNYDNPIQAPYNKEISSTTYSFIFNLDADKICVNSYTNSEVCEKGEKLRRITLALNAIKLVIDGNFGASKSRYTSFLERELIVAAVTKGDVLFTVSSPSMRLNDFIEETIERAKSYLKEFNKLTISLYVWVNKGKASELKINGKIIKDYINDVKSKLEENIKNRFKVEYIESYTHADLIDKIMDEVKQLDSG